jgi:hypothetical protein
MQPSSEGVATTPAPCALRNVALRRAFEDLGIVQETEPEAYPRAEETPTPFLAPAPEMTESIPLSSRAPVALRGEALREVLARLTAT